MPKVQVGDWVVITIKRPDYYGLSGRVVDYPPIPYGAYGNSIPLGKIIEWYPVQLMTDDLPTRLSHMQPAFGPFQDVYLFTRSQFEVEPWNAHAITVLGDEYFE